MKKNRKVVREVAPKATLPKNIRWTSQKSEIMDRLFVNLVLLLVTFAFGAGTLVAVGVIAGHVATGLELFLACAGAASLLIAVRFMDRSFGAYRELTRMDEREDLRRELLATVPVRIEPARLPVPFHDWYIH